MKRIDLVFAFVALLAVAFVPNQVAMGEQSRLSTYGRITLIEGTANGATSEAGPFSRLSEGDRIRPGQIVRTLADSRVEIRFLDGSIVRIAPGSEYRVESASFEGEARTSLKSKLSKGRVWARVAKVTNPRRSPFDISTPSALISVRGTVYDLVAEEDTSTEVSVYDGQVGVGPPLIEEDAEHEEIGWPEEVTEEEWEEIILGKLQRLRIGADGKPQDPVAFSPEAEQDPWVQWNLERDSI